MIMFETRIIINNSVVMIIKSIVLDMIMITYVKFIVIGLNVGHFNEESKIELMDLFEVLVCYLIIAFEVS